MDKENLIFVLLITLMYQKHKKWVLEPSEAAEEWSSSYSTLSKMFGGADALSEQFILENKIIPNWQNLGSKRKWSLIDIADWVLNTQNKSKL